MPHGDDDPVHLGFKESPKTLCGLSRAEDETADVPQVVIVRGEFMHLPTYGVAMLTNCPKCLEALNEPG